MGLPGCGKSSVIRELARLDDGEHFLEPEEDKWPQAVHERDTCGYITAITWFRAMRVPNLYAADQVRNAGKRAYVDSLYDKLVIYWLDKPGMEWLIPKEDRYFSVVKDLAALDRKLLPDPDVLILFEIDHEDWLKLVKRRGRKLDKAASFRESHSTQQYFISAGLQYAAETGIKVIRFKQILSSPLEAAESLKSQMIAEGML